MNGTTRRNVAIGACALALASAAGGAYAASGGSQLTQTQADRIERHAHRAGEPLLGPPPGGPHVLMLREGHGDFLDAAAKYLGLTAAQLRSRLDDGKSLADVAKAEGKSVEGLQDAIVADAKEHLDKAVADGDLTAAERADMLQGLRDHVDELVQSTPGRGGACGPGPGGPPPGLRRVPREGGSSGASTAPDVSVAPAPAPPIS